jgi:hypothetical protein
MKTGNIHSDDEKEDYYGTYDIGCTAALIIHGFKLCECDKANPDKVQFLFENSVKVQKAADDYFNDKLKVPARIMFDNIKMLKSRIYSD